MSDKEQEKLIEELQEMAKKTGLDFSEEIEKITKKLQSSKDAAAKVWKHVELARHSDRPRTLDYIEMIIDDFVELHGDRFYGDDPAMVGGIGFIEGIPVTVIGNMKGRNLRETIDRNGGMANPEGYRKALRLAKQAEKFHRPIITFIDTQGAYPGLGAEERGIGEAIAVNLKEFSQLKTPIICIIIGEGGSGGALGIGVGDKIYMMENAIYSVISPEGCASILWRDAAKFADAAEALKITSKDLLEFNIIDEEIKEPLGGAHTNYEETANNMKAAILKAFSELSKLSVDKLREERYAKFRAMGKFIEN